MNVIKFPGIGLEFNIDQILFSIGNINIYWYGFLIVMAFIIGLILLKKICKEFDFNFDTILEVFILIIPTSIFCARVYYILFNLEYYSNNINEIFSITSGGLAVYGGIIGGAIVTFIYTKLKKIDFLKFLDMIVIALPLGQAIGRWGNFFNVEAYGCITDSIFRMGIIKNGNYIEVHPTFLYESICCFLIYVFLFLNRKKEGKFKGENLCIYLFLYGIIRMVIEGLRIDSLMIGSFRVSQILSMLLVVIFGGILFYNKVILKNKEKM